jgi:chromosome partitioning protein
VANVIAVANQKGGVGKSTTALTLAHALHENGKQVLMVDLDSQAHLTLMSAVELVHDLGPRLHLLPGSIELAHSEVSLGRKQNREHRLREALDPVRNTYDYIIIDCPPNLGLLTINALTASDSVLIPLQLDFLALKGMQLLLNTVSEVRGSTNPGLEIIGILPTMARPRSLHSAEVEESVREFFGGVIFKTVVRTSVRFPEAAAGFRSILEYAPRHAGAQAYRDLAGEVISRTDRGGSG